MANFPQLGKSVLKTLIASSFATSREPDKHHSETYVKCLEELDYLSNQVWDFLEL
jgi:hypothetical protein